MKLSTLALATLGAANIVAWLAQQTSDERNDSDVPLTAIFAIVTNFIEEETKERHFRRRTAVVVDILLGITTTYLALKSANSFEKPLSNGFTANQIMRVMNVSHLALTARSCFEGARNRLFPRKVNIVRII